MSMGSEKTIQSFVAALSKRLVEHDAVVAYGLHQDPFEGPEWRVRITSKEGVVEYYSIFEGQQGWQWLCLYYF